MEQKENKKRKAGIVLICGTILSLLWLWIFPELLYPCWLKITFLPDWIYFPVEEFLALNVVHNTPFTTIGGFCIILATLIWALKLKGKPQKIYEYILLAVIVFLLAAMMLPCLCAPREKARRLRCRAYILQAYCEISLYADENNGKLPGTFIVKEIKHPISYYGKGHSLQEKPFVILEDAVRCHAGDLRHRMLSNGKIEYFYPWKIRK